MANYLLVLRDKLHQIQPKYFTTCYFYRLGSWVIYNHIWIWYSKSISKKISNYVNKIVSILVW